MSKSLNRKKVTSQAENPFMNVNRPKEDVKLKTMKVPEDTHKKLMALAKSKDVKLYELVGEIAEYYAEHGLTEQEKGIYGFLKNK
ncbi:hypothetical protein E2L07_19310 [Halalkalibacterium halodurans]|uniref:hypothetical protein n=1 Tax=Halalkalibacterium halodurans TaxID=86665 RepID=UPI0010682CAC|nr:hypothetical protein [Halalkalibacterium halodurans]TES47193.1 hypothetical protein E2L07_19310 [Halalkalibacterium halodurans]